MEFEKKILSVSPIKEAKLLTHALKASKEPDTGITINVKSAYNVIRDCATIASNYLPIHAYLAIPKPIKTLEGCFTKTIIKDFVKRANSEVYTSLLLRIILEDIKQHTNTNVTIVSTPIVDTDDSDDVYGDYDSITETKSVTPSLPVEELLFNAFNVTK